MYLVGWLVSWVSWLVGQLIGQLLVMYVGGAGFKERRALFSVLHHKTPGEGQSWEASLLLRPLLQFHITESPTRTTPLKTTFPQNLACPSWFCFDPLSKNHTSWDNFSRKPCPSDFYIKIPSAMITPLTLTFPQNIAPHNLNDLLSKDQHSFKTIFWKPCPS